MGLSFEWLALFKASWDFVLSFVPQYHQVPRRERQKVLLMIRKTFLSADQLLLKVEPVFCLWVLEWPPRQPSFKPKRRLVGHGWGQWRGRHLTSDPTPTYRQRRSLTVNKIKNKSIKFLNHKTMTNFRSFTPFEQTQWQWSFRLLLPFLPTN